MALQAFDDQGMVTWRCLIVDRDGEVLSCGEEKMAHSDEVAWVTLAGTGATMALPRCACGAQCSLKADYSLRELWKLTQAVMNEHGQVWAYTLPLIHVRNLRLHWRLYTEGRAETPPVLSKPPDGFLTHPQMAMLGDIDVVHALWYGFATVQAHVKRLGTTRTRPLRIEQERAHGTNRE